MKQIAMRPVQFYNFKTGFICPNCCLPEVFNNFFDLFSCQFVWYRLTFFISNCSWRFGYPLLLIFIQCCSTFPWTMMACFSAGMSQLYAGDCILTFYEIRNTSQKFNMLVL